jgi:hypothetical protein
MTSKEKALIALLIAAFLLSKSDIKAMASAILVARIASMKAAYSQANDAVGISDEGWEPDAELQSMAKSASEQDADSIASTYKDDLEVVATAFVVAWMLDHESLDGCEAAARKEISAWAIARAEWKSKQIANFTCGSGYNDGIDMWIGDFLDGDLDLPDGVTEDDVEVEIQPEDAVCKECKEYAGQRFSLDEADDIELPAHANCPHHKIIVLKES